MQHTRFLTPPHSCVVSVLQQTGANNITSLQEVMAFIKTQSYYSGFKVQVVYYYSLVMLILLVLGSYQFNLNILCRERKSITTNALIYSKRL